MSRTRFRCAIYTRKSTEEGLDQAFNSLDAQRSACEAYILSQAGEGWECLPDSYDDGGWSGGNIERPALKRLLEDIGRGRIDIVVVYKVDRLTRSLMDFARIVETFDGNNVSFVSVTQAFNTTNSMGRLTLNVLLSFAQFEREVTGERIRDKIAASKARGMWMGGNIPLGYDVQDRKLVINAAEAATVRLIFDRYLALGSLPAVAQQLAADGIRSKRWTSSRGRTHGGLPLRCGALAHILKNRIYRGEIVHKGKVHRGDHPAIITRAQFVAVEKLLGEHRQQRVRRRSRAVTSPLAGRIFDADGQALRPTFGHGRGKRIYRYYTSASLLPGGRGITTEKRTGLRLSAERTERFLCDRLVPLFGADASADEVLDAIERIDCLADQFAVTLRTDQLTACDEAILERARQIDPHARIIAQGLRLQFDRRPAIRGRTLAVPQDAQSDQRAALADLVRTAHRKLCELSASPLDPDQHVNMSAPNNAWTRDRIAIGLLAPDIQKALLLGTLPVVIDAAKLLSRDLPLDWDAQRQLFGLA